VRSGGSLDPWIERARQLVILKGSGAHDFKFGCAVLEDVGHISHAWRGLFLARAVFHLQGSNKSDNPLVERTQRAVTG
jgi:hypothetical protein